MKTNENYDLGPFHVYCITLGNKGDTTGLHAHAHDHLHIVRRGSVAVHAIEQGERVRLERGAGDVFLIKRGVAHEIECLEDDTQGMCLFARYDERGDMLANPMAGADMETSIKAGTTHG